MITIYFPSETTNRLQYVSEHIFTNILGINFEIISNKEEFLNIQNPSINYSNEDLEHGLQIIPSGLLTEEGVNPKNDLSISNWNNLFCFFSNNKENIPFDLFSATFYLLSLYEEYFPKQLDKHERFPHTESFLFRNNLLETPIIDRWAYSLKEEFEKRGYKTDDFRLRKYQTISTYDIDHPFLYQNKGLIKNTGGAIKDLLKGNVSAIKNRVLVQFRLEKDPYTKALELIKEVQESLNKPYHFFILLGDKGKYGVTTIYSPKQFYDYIKDLPNATIGLHPSYNSFRNLKQLLKEKKELEEILGYSINTSRQHFLRIQNPETFQELILAEITEDFTLAFANAPGFRSGTAIPYYFYDIQKEEKTTLLLRPTVMMDSTFIFHQKLTPEQTLEKIKKLIDECKQSGGDYLSLWHNSNLAYSIQENPWIEVYKQSYEYAVSLE